MYNSHFGLSEKPFALSPDPDFLYFTSSHRLAMTMLEYGIQNESGFTLISGDVGCGKTTLLKYLLRNIDNSHVVGLISNTHESFGDLIDLVLLAFGLDYKDKSNIEKYHTFENYLLEQYRSGQSTLLIVDEAQNLSPKMLEELRVISNINSGKDHVFQIVLSGQPEIRETLRLPELKQFAQRISSDFHLKPLTLEQLAEYIKYRLQVAGASRMLFTDKAIRMVFNFSKGVPRVANTFCDLALIYAFADGLEIVDWKTVMSVAIDKKNSGAIGIL